MITLLKVLPSRHSLRWHHALLHASIRAQSTRAVYETFPVQPLRDDIIAESVKLPRITPAHDTLDGHSAGQEAKQADVVPSVARKVVDKPTSFATETRHMKQQQQLRVLAGTGDLKLADFIEEVKTELWQYNAMPLRRRFRIQSLLRRLQTSHFETWIDGLVRAPDSSTRQFTRTLLARHESPPSLPSIEIPGFDMLLLCWKPQAVSLIHDHPEASCWMKVLKGTLKETRYTVATEENAESRGGDDGSSSEEFADSHGGGVSIGIDDEKGRRRILEETSNLTYAAGGVTYIEDSMGFHKMANPSPTEESVSLHLYAPGITKCSTWSDMYSISDSVRVPMDFDGTVELEEKDSLRPLDFEPTRENRGRGFCETRPRGDN